MNCVDRIYYDNKKTEESTEYKPTKKQMDTNQFIDSLKVGQTAAVRVTRVNNDKKTAKKLFSVEFAEKLTEASGSFNIRAIINKTLSTGGARRAFENFTRDELLVAFPQQLTAEQVDGMAIRQSSKDEGIWLGVKDPKITANGLDYYFKVRVDEIFAADATEWQLQNIDRAAKKRGADGPFIKGLNPKTNKVEHIFSNTRLDSAVMKDGQLVNVLNWSHNIIPEHIDTGDLPNVNTETGEITMETPVEAPLPSLD